MFSVCSASWICKLLSFVRLWKFSATFLLNYFFNPVFFLLCSRYSFDIKLRIFAIVSQAIFFLFSWFDLCFSDWIISVVLMRDFISDFCNFQFKVSIWFFLIPSTSLLKLSVFFFFLICFKHVHNWFWKCFYDGCWESLPDYSNTHVIWVLMSIDYLTSFKWKSSWFLVRGVTFDWNLDNFRIMFWESGSYLNHVFQQTSHSTPSARKRMLLGDCHVGGLLLASPDTGGFFHWELLLAGKRWAIKFPRGLHL